MDNYKIKIFPSAKRDLQEIVVYLNTLSHDAAIKYFDLIIENIGTLSELPARCPFVHNLTLKAKGYRILVIENYVVFFVIQDNIVQIRRILYGKRNYEWLL